MEWTYDVTRERIPMLQLQYEWMLQRRNRMASERVEAAPRRAWLWIAGIVAVVLVGLFVADSDALVHHPVLVGALAGLVIGTLLRSAGLGNRGSSRSGAWIGMRVSRHLGPKLGRVAARIYRKVAARAPYRITYRLEGGVLDTQAEAIGPIKRLELAKVNSVQFTEDIVFVLARTWSTHAKRTIYVGAERDAVVAAFVEAGVPCEPITGPVVGFTDPIPAAATRR